MPSQIVLAYFNPRCEEGTPWPQDFGEQISRLLGGRCRSGGSLGSVGMLPQRSKIEEGAKKNKKLGCSQQVVWCSFRLLNCADNFLFPSWSYSNILNNEVEI